MKIVTAALTTAIVGLLTLPLLANPNTAPAVAGCGDIGRVLATIRTLESGGNYTAKAAHASASGAYQIIDSTWAAWATAAGIGTQYEHASQAPPAVQDTVAGHQVKRLLEQHHDVSTIPLVWYYPATITNPALLDRVPAPQAGNTLTPRQYQAKWMKIYTAQAQADTTACAGEMPGVAAGT